ncbi:MAG: MaoC family dehydratase [Myxococcaceae bacterium]|nr:MaoC family dehydratase [Myxococcaceae bacterium]MCI0672662.1 MaoC family dehydratase [Myxococcaceae bacterium]
MPARKLYFESVRVGDELPALAKAPIDRVQLSRYAGASGDFNPVHVDETFAKSVGMPSVYAPGMLVMGMLGQLVSDWSRGAQLRRYQVRFIKMVWPGDTIVCKGRVVEREGSKGRYFAEADVWAENQKGELVMKGTARVQMFYSLEDENRQRAGQAPVEFEVPKETIRAPPPTTPEPPRQAELAPAARAEEANGKPAAKVAAAKKARK